MTNRTYISGPMTGIKNLNFPAFDEAARTLRSAGIEVVSPAEIKNGETWEACLRADLIEMLTCDSITLLPGWESSKGAHLELNVAHRIGMTVLFIGPLLSELQEGTALKLEVGQCYKRADGKDFMFLGATEGIFIGKSKNGWARFALSVEGQEAVLNLTDAAFVHIPVNKR